MNDSDNFPSESSKAAPGSQEVADADRRAALRRLGPLAVLTPPAVMSLLVSKRASAAFSEPPNDPARDDPPT